jgi:hypothetical protein
MWLGTREILVNLWLDKSLFVATSFGESKRQVEVMGVMQSSLASRSMRTVQFQ